MQPDPWNPDRYDRFQEERSRPFFDLLALVRARPGPRVVDLGCGTGALTRALHDRLQARETLGIDSSRAMLARSAEVAGGGLRFELGDIAAFAAGGEGGAGQAAGGAPVGPRPGGAPQAAAPAASQAAAPAAWDLVFSNAALQWVPDHPGLLARLTGLLAPGGQLAVQVPANYDHPSHLVAAEVAAEPPFAEALGGFRHAARPVLPPEEYAILLDRLGYREQHVRLQVYGHRLAGPEKVGAWVAGTLLTPYEARLSAELYARFLARYRERLLARLDDTRPYFFPFKRILLWGAR